MKPDSKTHVGMYRRAGVQLRVCLLLLAGLLVSGLPCQADSVALVLSGTQTPYRAAGLSLSKELESLGHSSSTHEFADLSELQIQQMIARGTKLFVAIGTHAALQLKKKLPKDTPLIFCMVSDPVSYGLPATDAGVSTDVSVEIQFELISEIEKGTPKIGMLYKSNEKGLRFLAQAKAALHPGWNLVAINTDDYTSMSSAIKALFRKRVDLVWTYPDRDIYNKASVRSLLMKSLREKTPVFGFAHPFVRAGALLGIGVEPTAQGKQAAKLAHRILKAEAVQGTQTAEKFQISINLIVAEKLSLRLPSSLRKRAEIVYGRN